MSLLFPAPTADAAPNIGQLEIEAENILRQVRYASYVLVVVLSVSSDTADQKSS